MLYIGYAVFVMYGLHTKPINRYPHRQVQLAGAEEGLSKLAKEFNKGREAKQGLGPMSKVYTCVCVSVCIYLFVYICYII